MAGKRRRRRHRRRPARSEALPPLLPCGRRAVCGCAWEGATGPGATARRWDAVARIWDAARPANAIPARTYLSRHGIRPVHHGRAPLPDSVRWLARERAPERDCAAGWHGLAPGAAGAVVVAWWCFGVQAPVAVTLVALDARGVPVPAPRRSVQVGMSVGATFEAGGWGGCDWDAILGGRG